MHSKREQRGSIDTIPKGLPFQMFVYDHNDMVSGALSLTGQFEVPTGKFLLRVLDILGKNSLFVDFGKWCVHCVYVYFYTLTFMMHVPHYARRIPDILRTHW